MRQACHWAAYIYYTQLQWLNVEFVRGLSQCFASSVHLVGDVGVTALLVLPTACATSKYVCKSLDRIPPAALFELSCYPCCRPELYGITSAVP